jgi:predicted nucleic acid-binding protein
MAIDRATLLFFDASCLVAAAGSATGGSSFLLSLCRRGLLAGAVSEPVLMETERNVDTRLSAGASYRYQELLRTTPLTIAPVPSPAQVRRWHDVVGEKDAHVVAAALAVNAAFLITLDQPLAQRITAAGLPLQALSPGQFIRELLPTHPDYPAVRE